MSMRDFFSVSLNQNTIHVCQYGNGPVLVILFHGFAESGADYERLGVLLEKDFTLLVPDLPFHGETQWQQGILSPELLVKLTEILMQHHGVKSCSVIGYSMGGRLALCLAQRRTGYLKKLVLVAPEGLRPNRWFDFVTGTQIGQILFKWETRHPQFFLFLVATGRSLKFINKGMARFIKEHIENDHSRLRVYHTWMCFRKLHIRQKTLFAFFKEKKLPVWIYFGKYDRLIRPSHNEKLKSLSNIEIKIEEGGHQLLSREAVLKDICTYLCRPDRT